MLASINPLGERSRNSWWGVTVTAYVVGSVAGGALMGGVAGLAGAALRAAVPVSTVTAGAIAGAAGAGALAFDLGGLRLPTVRRQVNEDWLMRYRGWVYGLGFGLQLGLGVVTVVTTATVYLTVMLTFLAGSPLAGVIAGVAFGIVRAVPVLGLARVHEPGQLRQVLRRLQRWAPAARGVAIVSAALVAMTSLAGAAWAT